MRKAATQNLLCNKVNFSDLLLLKCCFLVKNVEQRSQCFIIKYVEKLRRVVFHTGMKDSYIKYFFDPALPGCNEKRPHFIYSLQLSYKEMTLAFVHLLFQPACYPAPAPI